MLEIRYNIIRFNTNLPYNCVYYIYDSEKSENFTLPDRYASEYVNKVQGFTFHFQKVNYESLTEEMLLKEKCIAPNTGRALTDDIIRTLRKIFPKSEHGCFIVRLLPYRDNDNDNEADTFMIGEIANESSRHDAELFIRKVAKQNSERMTGLTYSHYQDMVDALIDDTPSCTTGYSELTLGFQTSYISSRNYYIPNRQEEKEMLKKEYFRKFKNLVNDPKSIPEQIVDLIYMGYEDFNNIGKLNTDCPIIIDQDDRGDYGIFICPDEGESILCDFNRGWQSKALYVFFLRHPEGVRLKELKNPQAIQEIAQIYAKFKIYDMDTALQKAKAAVDAITVYKNDINDLFNRLFVPCHACNYIIAPLDKSKECRYGINLDEDLIDLGIFNKAL